jgi:hypothetical protein
VFSIRAAATVPDPVEPDWDAELLNLSVGSVDEEMGWGEVDPNNNMLTELMPELFGACGGEVDPEMQAAPLVYLPPTPPRYEPEVEEISDAEGTTEGTAELPVSSPPSGDGLVRHPSSEMGAGAQLSGEAGAVIQPSAEVGLGQEEVVDVDILDGCPVSAALIASTVENFPGHSSAALFHEISSRVALSPPGRAVLRASVDAAVATHRLLATDLLTMWTAAAVVDPSGVTGLQQIVTYLRSAIMRPQ